MFIIKTSPIALTNWCGIITPLAPPSMFIKPEPILILHPSILLSTKLTSSICPNKSPSEVYTCLPITSHTFFILNISNSIPNTIYTLCFSNIYSKNHTNNLYKKDLRQKIKAEKYEVVVALYPERQISRLFYKAEIPYRIGTAGRFHSVFFNTHLVHSRKKNLKHEFEYNLDFLTFFKGGRTVRFPNVYLREKELNNAQRILNNAGVKEDFVVIHPGSGGSAERWPVEKFVRLYKLLNKEGVELVISGSEEEGEVIEAASQKLNVSIRKITGETDMRTLAAVLSLAHVVVANSTGPLHLAVAVGTKAVGLYPSRKAMSPLRWGPLGQSDQVIQPVGVECQCPPRKCTCMETVKPERVLRKVMELLAKGNGDYRS